VFVALSACATDVASRADLAELTASVRALRADNARLEKRIDRIEQQGMIARVKAETRELTPTRPKAAPAASDTALPELTVVKLKPKREPAPPLLTNVDVQEPSPSVADALSPKEKAKEAAEDAANDAAFAEAQYNAGLEALKTGDVEGGITQLKKFAADWPHHPRADNALYFAGVGLFSSGRLQEAADMFSDTITRYPAGDAVVDSMLKLADCHLRLNQPQAARATWQKVVNSYPGTAAASQAQARLANHTSPH